MTQKLDNSNAWMVRFDIDAQYQARTYKKHMHILVLASTADRAIAITKEHYPGAEVWAVNHQHKDAVVLIDEATK